MLISVIIATKNEEKNIKNCLESVKNQDFPPENIEIIVVDNYSSDRTIAIVENMREKLAPLNIKLFNGGPERSSQKNFGVNLAKGKYFLHLDADMVLSKNVMRECVSKVFSNDKIIALYIPEIVSGEEYFSKVRRFERSFYNGTVIDGVRFISRDKFLEIGGFDENLYACEDWDLDKRLKRLGKFDFVKSPLFHNEKEFSLKKYLAKKSYYSENIDMYIKKWGKDDLDIKKQFGFYYRYIGVFFENGKWRRLVRHPILAGGMLVLRFFVGFIFMTRK